MKIISKSSKDLKYLKIYLLLFIISSSYLIEVTSKIKIKENIVSRNLNSKKNKTTLKKFNSSFSRNNNKRTSRKHKKSLRTKFKKLGEDTKKESPQALIPKSVTDAIKQALSLKIINSSKKNQLEKPKNGCLRVYDQPNFESINFKEICDEAQYSEITAIENPSSILIADDVKVVFYYEIDNKEQEKNIFNESKEIRNYPFNYYNDNKKLLTVKQGSVFISELVHFKGQSKLINAGTKEQLGFSTIGSVLLGKNTFLDITLKKGKNIQITKDTFKHSIIDVAKIDIIIQDDIIIPQIDPDCIMIFKCAMFDSCKKVPFTFCTDTSTLNGASKYPLAKTINEAEKEINSTNLDKLPTKLRLSMGSILVGSRVTAVAFTKTYLEGTAYVFDEMLFSSDNSELKDKIESIYLLKPGCFMLFIPKHYEDPNGKNDHLRLCSSLNSYYKASWGTHYPEGLVLGKNTVIEIYEKENYQGKKTIFSHSQRDLHIELFHNVGSIKIVKPSSSEIDLLSPDFNNMGCLLFFNEEKFKGFSKLICDDQHFNLDSFYLKKMKSIKITPGNDMIIHYLSLNFFQKDKSRVIHLDKSAETIPDNKNARFQKLELIKENCIMFFSKCYYTGSSLSICEDISDLSAESNRLGDYSSVLVGKNTVVFFHNLINFTTSEGSNPYKITENIPCSLKDKRAKKVFQNIGSIEFQMSNNPQKLKTIPDTGYSVSNFILGALLGLFDEDFKEKGSAESSRNTILKCIPEKFKKEVSPEETTELEESVIDYNKSTDSFFTKFLNGGGSILKKIITWYCNFKEKMFLYVSYLAKAIGWLPKKEEKSEAEGWLKQIKSGIEVIQEHGEYGEQAINYADVEREILSKQSATSAGQPEQKDNLYQKSTSTGQPMKKKRNKKRLSPTSRKFRVKFSSKSKKFFDFLYKLKEWIKDKTQDFFVSYIYAPFIKVKDFIYGIIEKIKSFFRRPAILATINAVGCVVYGIATIADKVESFIANIQVLILGISTAITGFGIVILLDFLLSQLCNLKYLKLALNYFYLGNKMIRELNRPLAFSYYGLAVGTTFNSIATAESFTGKIQSLVKSALEIDYDSVKKKFDGFKEMLTKKY